MLGKQTQTLKKKLLSVIGRRILLGL